MPNAAPTVASAASVAANPVSGTTATLDVLGTDDGGEEHTAPGEAVAEATEPTTTV
jgi:hypothetical protein